MDEDSVEYWKEKYEDLNAQYDDFQKSSQELEHELEVQLKHSENQIKELSSRNNRVANENETLKTKIKDLNISTHVLQEELAKFKAVKEEMQKYIRELEQKNDNLEQTNRCAMFSLGEFEAKMNEALEQNAILHSEMEAKDDLAETVQRLRDETRDLKQELAVRQKVNQTLNLKHTMEASAVLNSINNMETSPVPASTVSASEEITVAKEQTKTTLETHQQTLNTILNELNLQQHMQNKTKLIGSLNGVQHQMTSMSPSERINALNYVGDALRKVTVIK